VVLGKRVSALYALLLLASCDANGGLGKEGSPVWFTRTSPAEQVAYFQKVCESYGYKAGTRQMQDCTVTEMRTSKAQASAIMAGAASASHVTVYNSNTNY